MIFAVVSDIHAYNSTVYSHTNSDGVNSRLRIILDELKRAAAVLKAAGGSTMIVAGDIFHVRGSIDPEVLNPLRATIEEILLDDINIYAIPGNHDLKSKDSRKLSSQIENLAQISITGGMFRCFSEPTIIRMGPEIFGFAPWRNTVPDLMNDLAELRKHPDTEKAHVFIHAGIDGVISGMSAHGLTHTDLEAIGFKRIYAGHYHNHKVFPGGSVVSIGATTHHNWGDIGTRAGFLIVDTVADTVTFHDTQAPKFHDISGLSEGDIELLCMGNYVRFRGPTMTQGEIDDLKNQLVKWGALGVSIEVPRATVATRATAGPTVKGVTLEKSVDNFIDGATNIPASIDKERLKLRCQEVLTSSRARAA